MASKQSEELYFDPRNLPVLVAENIASHLNGLDLINLGLTCKFWYEIATNNAVWKDISEKRFGKLAGERANENFKEVYFDLGRTKMPVADFYHIVHLGNRYLKKIDDPKSSSGSVIYLVEVCWLQVDGKFHAVLPGKYRVLWRMKLRDAFMRSSGEACIYYKATKLGDSCGSQLSCKWDENKLQEQEKRHGTNKWFVFDTGELTVESMCDVHVEIHGRNDYWCGGFYWDYVQLKSVTNPSTESKKNIRLSKGSCEVM